MPQENGNEAVNGTKDTDRLPSLSTSADDFLAPKYDFIIVGGGTAGLCVAARLTENPDTIVGVLEAGSNHLGDMLVDTPALFTQMLNKKEYDYGFMSEPQKGNKGKRHNILRGKGLGGSSAINYMMYVRGSNQDYDDWASIIGDSDWNSQAMKKYMRKHQTLEPIEEDVINITPLVDENHGTSGPVRTSMNDWRLPIEDDWISACQEVTGYEKRPVDAWSGDHIGFYNTLGLVARTGPNKGKRSYAARAYFEPNANRANLHVLCNATVASVELDSNGKATGVSFFHGDAKHTVAVEKEVVLAAGTFQSPQVLEMSGIGDPDVLGKAGIACKVASKSVGNNLQDHVLSAVGYELAPGFDSLESLFRPEIMMDAQKQLIEKQAGPLTCISSSQGFLSYKLFASESEQEAIQKSIKETPNLSPLQQKQYKCIAENLKDDRSANLQAAFMGGTINWSHGIEDQSVLFPPPSSPDQPQGIVFAPLLQYPLSRGSVHIRSSDPYEQPSIDPALLTHPADVAVLAAGMTFCDRVAKSQYLKDKIAKRTLPGPDVDLQKPEDAAEAVRDFCMTEYHPIGTCAMGEVVDSKLKVKGVTGLRIVDASVFPSHVSGNIVSSVYAVAEKAADLIKVDWNFAANGRSTY